MRTSLGPWACLGPIGPGPVGAHKFRGRRPTKWVSGGGGFGRLGIKCKKVYASYAKKLHHFFLVVLRLVFMGALDAFMVFFAMVLLYC